MMELDPVLVIAARCAVALLFAFSCWSKLRDYGVFKATLADYEILPSRMVGPAAILVVAAEFAVAINALLPLLAASAMRGAIVLLLLYALGIGVNLLRGRRDIDCGCTGPASSQLLSGWLLVRNGVLIALAWLGLQTSAARELALLDYGLLAIVLCVGCLLYAALNQLMANTPRLDAMDAIMEAN